MSRSRFNRGSLTAQAFIIEKRAPEGDVTQVERRYSEFAELHQRLTKALPSVRFFMLFFSLPHSRAYFCQFKASLPKKTKLFGDLSYEEQQTRRVMLEKYLIEILASNVRPDLELFSFARSLLTRHAMYRK